MVARCVYLLKPKVMNIRLSLLVFLFSFVLFAQDEPAMSFEDYNPTSTLVVPENIVKRAKFPFVDMHSHQWNLTIPAINKLAGEMDELNMGALVNLSGRGFDRAAGDIGSQAYLAGMVRRVEGEAPGKIVVFTNVSFKDFGKEGWTENAVKELEEDYQAGARGLKIYKSLGLRNTDQDGNRIEIDDPRIDPIWAKCGELGIPVLIHAADPAPFWDEMDADNERWLELKLRPGRKRGPDNPAPFEEIIAEQHNVFRKHPTTTFVNAHMGWMANNLDKAGQHLDTYPNVYFGIGAVIAEFGRQPKRAGAFFEKYQDRLVFGKDSYNPEEFWTYFRVLETEDEYFPYYKKYHAFWRMYGLGLPDEVLKKVYYKNACKIIPGLELSQFE